MQACKFEKDANSKKLDPQKQTLSFQNVDKARFFFSRGGLTRGCLLGRDTVLGCGGNVYATTEQLLIAVSSYR